MRQGKLFSGIFIVLMFCGTGFGVPTKLQKKVNKEVVKVFDVEEVSFKSVIVSKALNEKLPTKIKETNFFKIFNKEVLLGYAFLDKASSKTAKFDYLVIFNNKLEIESSKVLIYREEYGGEIGSHRWLKQFLGLSGKDRVKMGDNIDAIAGATISVRSMTKSIDSLLQTIGILQDNHIL